MEYVSTRDSSEKKSFRDVVLSGLAPDGGLYVPHHIPEFSTEEISKWVLLPFDELAYKVISPFTDHTIDKAALKALICDSYAEFRHRAITPLQQIGHNEWILQLFHGPTQASKDFAAQLQIRLLDHYLSTIDKPIVLIGASNGDTGVAVIEAVKGREDIQLIILYPSDGVPINRLNQILAASNSQINTIGIEGNYDDCQRLVSHLLKEWPKPEVLPVSFNSINWIGVLAQIVFFFYAALQLGGGYRPIGFSIPAASFAEIYASYIAQKMGLPINQVIISTNLNDSLHKFIQYNSYSTQIINRTLSPAMDFSLFSNIERFIWELYGHDDKAISNLMNNFEKNGELRIDNQIWLKAKMLFDSYSVSDSEIQEELLTLVRETGCKVDVITAVGTLAARLYRRSTLTPIVTLGQLAPSKSSDLLLELDCFQGISIDEAQVLPHYQLVKHHDLAKLKWLVEIL